MPSPGILPMYAVPVVAFVALATPSPGILLVVLVGSSALSGSSSAVMILTPSFSVVSGVQVVSNNKKSFRMIFLSCAVAKSYFFPFAPLPPIRKGL
jgi:hypothetical protein